MSDVAMDRLYRLPAFQDWLSRATAKVREEVDQRVAKAQAEARAEARAEAGREALIGYFMATGENLSPEALATINACTDDAVLQSWLMRAYHGESAAKIFPVPEA